MNLRIFATAIASIAAVTATSAIVGCDNDSAENRAERAGDRVENAAEKAGNNMEKAADKAGDKLERAGDKVKDAAD